MFLYTFRTFDKCSNAVFGKFSCGILSKHLTSVHMTCSESVPWGTLFEHLTSVQMKCSEIVPWGTLSEHSGNVPLVQFLDI